MIMRVAAVAAAVASPTFDAVRAAPGCVFADLHFKSWRMQSEVFAVIRQPCQSLALDLTNRVCERHIAELEMMAECFAVRCDVHQLGMIPVTREARYQALGESIAALEEAFERDVV